jgi:hypothetical protein
MNRVGECLCVYRSLFTYLQGKKLGAGPEPIHTRTFTPHTRIDPEDRGNMCL